MIPPVDPEVIALRDKEEFEVEAILDDTIDVDTPTRLEISRTLERI